MSPQPTGTKKRDGQTNTWYSLITYSPMRYFATAACQDVTVRRPK